ncbi:MAG: molybdopterin oxidoreductase [Bdellovibrionaceae bacterium]|nr:molybdopterin oxidoreductase [Pseudobdellovibrionaceae bacterium]MDW8190659.1 molybdopterin oxidoreductase [Pseudobdellovibrionaceae bacterium]
MGHQHSVDLKMQPFKASQGLKTVVVASIALGIFTLAIGWLQSPQRTWFSFLTAFVFVVGLSSGGFFFVAIQHIAKAGWSTSIRRIGESVTSFFPCILIGSLVLLGGIKELYPWARSEVVASNPVIAAKTGYLNVPFFIVRALLFSLIMIFFGKKIVGNSLLQDQSGDEQLTHKNLTYSVVWVLLFALSFSFFTVDLLMSLLPTWYSTIFAIYVFSGSVQSALAFILLMMLYLKNRGYIEGYYGADHMHDMAKYLKGFSIFWAYIAFSQFMLIWYANIPEETEFFLMRAYGPWAFYSILLLILKFVVPFLVLLPRGSKRSESVVAAISVLVIISQYMDIYWLVYPNYNYQQIVFGFYEIGILAGVFGIFILGLVRFFEKHPLVALKDPRLHEALEHHVTY